MTNKYMDNEDGSVGGIFILISIFLLGAFCFIVNGFVIDQLTSVANSGMFLGIASSQMRFDIFSLTIDVFRFNAILVLLGLGLNHIIDANSSTSSVVPLSSLAFGVLELEFISTIIMAVTMFGGYGIDTVVSTISDSGLGASDTMGTSGYTLIQYIPNIFYGFMLLIMIGLSVKFILQCVQVSEHSNSLNMF